MLIAPLSLTHFAQIGLAPLSSLTSLTALTVKEFFQNLFLHPGDHFIPLIVLGGVVVAACVGLALLIKMIYKKYAPTPQP